VFAGEGIATRKYDGLCCLIKDGVFFKRREIKKAKPEPDGFILADEDAITGKRVGWMAVDFASKEDQYHAEAFKRSQDQVLGDGTYELCGPKIQGNPEGYETQILIPHEQAVRYPDAPIDLDALRAWLVEQDIEGCVWHHPDGRMAKIKKKDFGFSR